MTCHTHSLTESTVEDSVLEWLRSLELQIAYPSEIVPNEIGSERDRPDR